MTDLDELLQRDGMELDERLLVRIQACLWPGDHDGLRACLRACRRHDVPRVSVEEVFLQGILFCGFPRIVNAFRVLEHEWPTSARTDDGPRRHAEAKKAPRPADVRAAGESLFDMIYAHNSETVKDMLQGYHSELLDFVLDTAYGRILTRPGLQPRVRELVAVGVLALTNQVPQLIAHGRGAQRFGATEDQLREAIYTATGDGELADTLVRRI